jgi:hypothetical protein
MSLPPTSELLTKSSLAPAPLAHCLPQLALYTTSPAGQGCRRKMKHKLLSCALKIQPSTQTGFNKQRTYSIGMHAVLRVVNKTSAVKKACPKATANPFT